MEDQKIENLLNLALDATQAERERSQSLEIGYDESTQTWEVIVRYSGSLVGIVPEYWSVVELSSGYAIVTLPQTDVDALAALPQIEYVEKPKRLYFEVDAGRAASCVSAVQTPALNLTGTGILVAVIDSGVDYFHPDFRNEDGTTRIEALWDQTGSLSSGGQLVGKVPAGFDRGVEYTAEEINRALSADSRLQGLSVVPEEDTTGHGTQVLGIAAGNGRASGGQYRGMAPGSGLLVVKLGMARAEGFPRTTELMLALEYVVRKARELDKPVAINLSFGNVYGSHRGSSLLESFMDRLADQGRIVIVAGTGNEGNTGGHAGGTLTMGQTEIIEFLIDSYETSLSIQLWKNYADEFNIYMLHPDGRQIGPFSREIGAARYRLGNQTLLVYYGEPAPYQGDQEIYLDFIPNDTYLDSGVWRILLEPRRLVTGNYNLWMSDSRGRGGGTRFLQPSPDTTMTIPSTAAKAIAVGAYDARRNVYAPFSGRGWPRQFYQIRPDLAAPGVAVTTTAPGGGYTSVSGTSFAAPFVTGAAALLMQWGIVNGNDPYLYGEKVRAYLRRGARQFPGFDEWPNNQLGYGALCVRDSLPV